MTNQELLNKIAVAKKGRYINLTKVKDLGNGVIKESDMVIRLGVAYANMAINADRETGSLPWGHWVDGLENLVIEHTKFDKKLDKEVTNYYLRITSTDPAHPESGADVIATRYLLDGVEISKDQAVGIVGAKKMESKGSAVYNVKFENILRLGSNAA